MRSFLRLFFIVLWLCAASSPADTNSAPAVLPSSFWQYPKLEVRSISGSKGRFALINDQTMAAGERAKVRLGEGRVAVECVQIRDRTVMVRVGDDEELRELQLRQPKLIYPTGPVSPSESDLSGLMIPSAGERNRHHRGTICIVNSRAFRVGKKADMRVKGRIVTVECLGIRSNSVVLRVDAEIRELPRNASCTAARLLQ